MGSALERNLQTGDQTGTHRERMDWAQSVIASLRVDTALADAALLAPYPLSGQDTNVFTVGLKRDASIKAQLKRALAQRLLATFGSDNGKIVLDNTYRIHETPEEAAHARELFDGLYGELQSQGDPLTLEMIGERNIAGLLSDKFRVGADFTLDQFAQPEPEQL